MQPDVNLINLRAEKIGGFNMKIETKKKLLFLAIFTVIALVCYQINFSSILGTENKSFTLFQFIGPIGAGIFSPAFGAVSVIVVELIHTATTGVTDLFSVARIFPMAVAAIYFGTKRKAISAVPLLCIALFWLNPIGAQAWIYPLYWLIPVIGAFWFKDNLFMRSLGTTFTAHAVGSTAFLYVYGMTPQFWLALIPVVFVERILFALGISVSFVAANTLVQKAGLPFLNIDPRYVLSWSKIKQLVVAPLHVPRSQ